HSLTQATQVQIATAGAQLTTTGLQAAGVATGITARTQISQATQIDTQASQRKLTQATQIEITTAGAQLTTTGLQAAGVATGITARTQVSQATQIHHTTKVRTPHTGTTGAARIPRGPERRRTTDNRQSQTPERKRQTPQ
ncbi:hypothetical protein H849_24538, partial [Prescottella equi NBRC 101255 = C 7]